MIITFWRGYITHVQKQSFMRIINLLYTILYAWGSKESQNRIRLSQFLMNKLVVFGVV